MDSHHSHAAQFAYGSVPPSAPVSARVRLRPGQLLRTKRFRKAARVKQPAGSAGIVCSVLHAFASA